MLIGSVLIIATRMRIRFVYSIVLSHLFLVSQYKRTLVGKNDGYPLKLGDVVVLVVTELAQRRPQASGIASYLQQSGRIDNALPKLLVLLFQLAIVKFCQGLSEDETKTCLLTAILNLSALLLWAKRPKRSCATAPRFTEGILLKDTDVACIWQFSDEVCPQ